MRLASKLFQNDKRLFECQEYDAAHVKTGDRGEHVAKIQTAVCRLNGYRISFSEVSDRLYGPSTAAAVLDFKRRRNIVNHAYQSVADNIVGKMTIAALDREIALLERLPPQRPPGAWRIG